MARSLSPWCGSLFSADSRQLLSRQHENHPLSAHERARGHETRVFRDHLTDEGCVSPQGMSPHGLERCVGLVRWHDGDQLALVGDVKWVKTEHLASAAHYVAQWNARLVDFHADFRRGRKLV